MSDEFKLKTIAHIRSDFPSKFGIPRQSGLAESLKAEIIFTPEYRNPDALRGLEGFSHLWLIWQFSKAVREEWSPTVRPPRLGGNARMGVFATRSPFRPNPLGLSSVKLEEIVYSSPDGPIIRVAGADLMDGTPIYDIKPYLPYTDAHPEATGGFAPEASERVRVEIPENIASAMPQDKLSALIQVLEQDPRPAYQNDPKRIYGFDFSEFQVRFTATQDCITVCEILKK